MLKDDARKHLFWLGLSTAMACAAGSGSGPQSPEGESRGAAAPPAAFEAVLTAPPPSSPSSAPGAPPGAAPSATPASAPPASASPAAAPGAPPAASTSASPAPAGANAVTSAPSPAPAASGALECIAAPDPDIDKESPWSRELGQRLEFMLPSLRSCTSNLPPDEQTLTLRLVYAKDGAPVSQHVVTSTPGACAASECLKQGLASVHSPRLLIDKASIDLNLSLSRGRAPKRSSEPVDPLTPEPLPEDGEGCVDPAVAQLSRVAVREIVSHVHQRLQKCYGLGLERDHSLTGKVDFEFVIGQDGAVSEAWARDATLRDCEAIQCMLAEFRGLHFPEPVGRSVRVLYPINYLLEQSPMTLR